MRKAMLCKTARRNGVRSIEANAHTRTMPEYNDETKRNKTKRERDTRENTQRELRHRLHRDPLIKIRISHTVSPLYFSGWHVAALIRCIASWAADTRVPQFASNANGRSRWLYCSRKIRVQPSAPREIYAVSSRDRYVHTRGVWVCH